MRDYVNHKYSQYAHFFVLIHLPHVCCLLQRCNRIL
jgi:hypothetical protein